MNSFTAQHYSSFLPVANLQCACIWQATLLNLNLNIVKKLYSTNSVLYKRRQNTKPFSALLAGSSFGFGGCGLTHLRFLKFNINDFIFPNFNAKQTICGSIPDLH